MPAEKEKAISSQIKLEKEMAARELAQAHVPLAPRSGTPYAAVEQEFLSPDEEPKVCVVVTSYNVASYIDQSIRSIVQQTYRNLEVIVVDDASNDGTQQIINEWMERDSRIKAVKMPFGTMGGAGQPTNRGIDMCTGKYLALADGDDFMHVEMYRQMVAKAEKLSLDLTLSSFGTFENTPEKLIIERTYDAKHWNGMIRHCVAKATGSRGVIKPTKCGRLFRISPVPWRKRRA